MPSPLGQLQQLTINDNSNDEATEMTSNEPTFIASHATTLSNDVMTSNVVDDDVEATRQKILDDILSTEDQKIIPENFEAILNPIYFDFAT